MGWSTRIKSIPWGCMDILWNYCFVTLTIFVSVLTNVLLSFSLLPLEAKRFPLLKGRPIILFVFFNKGKLFKFETKNIIW